MIEIKDMSFGYKKKLFSELNLSLQPGNIYGLLGKNGAGKTTLLKLICGLRFPQGGQCSVLGFQPAHRPVHLLEQICFIAEEIHVPAISPDLYEKLYAPFYPRFDHEMFVGHLREFELDTTKRLTEMSYGQKKKFMVSFGLASRCRLVLLDEPTNGMDIPSKSQFRRLLARSLGEDQIILISTHQVRDMENLIDPIIVLDGGRIVFQQDMETASRRLTVTMEREEPADALWAEKTLGGWVAVRENTGSQESRIDLEVLFNTVINSTERVQALFGAPQGKETTHGNAN